MKIAAYHLEKWLQSEKCKRHTLKVLHRYRMAGGCADTKTVIKAIINNSLSAFWQEKLNKEA